MRISHLILTWLLLSMLGGAAFAQKTKIAVANIREIFLETGDGFCADCERTTTLRASGAAAYHGGKNSHVRKGDFSGTIGAENFKRLAKEIITAGFFDLAPLYEGATKDVATVKITVVYSGGQKTIENFGRSDEPRLLKIERTFNAAADKIKWRDDQPQEKRLPEFDQFSYRGASVVRFTGKRTNRAARSDREFSVPCAKALNIGLEQVTELHSKDITRRLRGSEGDSDTELLIEKNALENYLRCRRSNNEKKFKKLPADERAFIAQIAKTARRIAQMRVDLIYGVQFDERYDDPVNYAISQKAVAFVEDYKGQMTSVYLEVRDYDAFSQTAAAERDIEKIGALLKRIEKLSLESDQAAEFAAFKTEIEKILADIKDEVGNEKHTTTVFLVRLLQMNLPANG